MSLILLDVVVLWLYFPITEGALAPSSSQRYYIAKTQETFKFSELQHLEVQLQALKRKDQYECHRLLLDSATGSSLFRLDFKSSSNYKSANQTNDSPQVEHALVGAQLDPINLPPSLARCDWIAEALCHGESAQEMIEVLAGQGGVNLNDCTGWMLDYIRMNSVTGNKGKHELKYNQKTLLCSVAPWILQAPPVLETKDASDQLILVETMEQGMFLGRITWRATHSFSSFQKSWTNRPFQYSSAIHPTVAEIVVDLLLDLVSSNGEQNINREDPLCLLDPACGSGTLLAFALAKKENFWVEGYDINPQCVKGTKTNLQHTFGEEILNRCTIQVKDSSVAKEADSKLQKVHCAVANFPWGLNTKTYVDQNIRIMKSMRTRLNDGAPCIFIHKDEKISSSNTMASLGYQILGEAFIPPLDFALPKSGKKKKQGGIDSSEPSAPENTRIHKHQRITVVIASRSQK